MSIITAAGVIMLAAAAYIKGSLNKSGAVTAVLVAMMIGAAFDLFGLLVLALFFITSSVLGKWLDKKLPADETGEKGNCRDWAQVMANGGWPAVAAILFLLTSDPAWVIAFSAGFAAAASDTWASEFGRLSRQKPVDLLRLKRVEKGRSGAVSLPGTAGAAGGAAAVAAGAVLFSGFTGNLLTWEQAVLIGAAGFTGQLIDTIAGGTVQTLYQCQRCGIKTERKSHCGLAVKKIRGVSWISNDAVNHLCTLSAVLIGYSASRLFM
ncbi:DUF92 domain-containing protein [Alteribacter natronophilus]|uniref:DUF92 domain-containing protein n=1 Tax=Alteribacter natronophilus TaxID=2583810 RepID=UPI00110EE38D|nr:DUF92 domain-containing protein [Alteribacter natronophilus]TMW73803.1 DUF92 domain-containing protein [Alteribacter natronophilus]